MRRKGILCPGLLTLIISSTAANAEQIVEFSMYDAFGDIMFNSPGQLVRNQRSQKLELEEPIDQETSLDKYRYRDHQYLSTKKPLRYPSAGTGDNRNSLTSKKFRAGKQQEWKFRPLDDDKKQVIKIEDEPVQKMLRPQANRSAQAYQPSSVSPYMPAMPMPMVPMMPMAPGMPYGSAVRPELMPGVMPGVMPGFVPGITPGMPAAPGMYLPLFPY